VITHTVPEPLDEALDHVRGPAGAHVILEYGDYECPYSRAAYRQIQQAQGKVDIRFAFRHFPLTGKHPHALEASAAAEAAALQGRFWEMHELLFRRQEALEDTDLRAYARELRLDPVAFEIDRRSPDVLARIGRDVQSGLATGQIQGTPALFLDGVVHRDSYRAQALVDALTP
jgi:protein-disulfide isomerase